MAAQACGHRPWDAARLEAFMGYWGHAARLSQELHRPIKIALQVRDESWMAAHPLTRRRMASPGVDAGSLRTPPPGNSWQETEEDGRNSHQKSSKSRAFSKIASMQTCMM